MKEPAHAHREGTIAPSPPETARLDESVTRLFLRLRDAVVRNWKVLVALALVGLVSVAAYQVLDNVSRGKEATFFARLHELTVGSSTSSALPPLADFEALVDDVRGTKPERVILKLVTADLLDRAAVLEVKSRGTLGENQEDAGASAPPGTPPDPKAETDRQAVLAAAERIVAKAADRLGKAPVTDSTSEDFAAWIENTRRYIDAAKAPPLKPAKRPFVPVPPSRLQAPAASDAAAPRGSITPAGNDPPK